MGFFAKKVGIKVVALELLHRPLAAPRNGKN
jgi:hypothetical protein